LKFKYYLRGTGIGILVTTIILMIAFSNHPKSMTADEIIEAAGKLGMVMAEENNSDADDNDNSSDENDNQNGLGDEDETSSDDQSGIDEESSDDGEASDSDDETTDDETADDGADDSAVTEIKLVIKGGEYSDTVCEKLEEAGLIPDAEEYNKWLANEGYDELIQPGTFYIPSNSSREEIAKIITTKNN